jgi:hypothetical protein
MQEAPALQKKERKKRNKNEGGCDEGEQGTSEVPQVRKYP